MLHGQVTSISAEVRKMKQVVEEMKTKEANTARDNKFTIANLQVSIK